MQNVCMSDFIRIYFYDVILRLRLAGGGGGGNTFNKTLRITEN